MPPLPPFPPCTGPCTGSTKHALQPPRTPPPIKPEQTPGNGQTRRPKKHLNSRGGYPPAWLRLLVSQQRQAQWDLEQLHIMCGSVYDQSDKRIQRIEEMYTQITGAIEYVYGQAQANAWASSDWMQTELMRMANAAQKFTNNIRAAIQLRDQWKTNEDINRDTCLL